MKTALLSFGFFCNTLNFLFFASGLCYIGQE